ncbi:hypothetical protein CAEBREN_25025 [Caenorhabditis brenneri]|uniref:Uncharacterized protein n=1 Tax=Caenorhabditis brenneri TaxID=135651 RepID=G0N772_CAEBE|nr:hypothetical protein CAEBREN_25025 [Caenorhabditis brenneri]
MRLGSLGIFMLYYIELANATNPIVVVPLILIKVPSWRKKFFGGFVGFKEKLKLGKVSPEVTVSKARSHSQLQTEEYFEQLRKAWT